MAVAWQPADQLSAARLGRGEADLRSPLAVEPAAIAPPRALPRWLIATGGGGPPQPRRGFSAGGSLSEQRLAEPSFSNFPFSPLFGCSAF